MTSNKLLKDRKLYVIFSITLIAVMGVASITPALPKISETLDLTKTQIGLLISAFTFPGIILTPLAGILADRLGRKAILVPSLFIFALAGFAIFFFHDFHHIILLRVIQGIGAASLGSLNTTLIGDFFKAKQLPEAMGYNATVLSLSTAFYPLIGGILAGFAWYYPFVMPLLAIPVGLFVIFGMKEPEIEKPLNFKQYLKDISGNILKKEVIAIFILGTLTFIILYGAFLTYMPILLDHKFNLTAPKIGIFITLSSVTSAIVATQVGKLTWKFGSLFLLKTAFLLYLIVNILIPNIANMYVFLIPILIFGSAQALNIPSLQTTLAKLAPDNQRGVFMSLNGMVIRLGQTLGPMIIGIGYSLRGLIGAYYLGAFMALLGLIVSFTMINENKTISKRD
ncbi:MAG: MFS transporter [Bacteroidales bacterium]|jgi:ACDE family multidrug resistance protein|nr:MFS transporter [Bacteroidales bacterium]